MKLRNPYVWKSGLAALGVLSLVSFQSVSAQTATPTPSSGSTTTVTTPVTGNSTTGDGKTEMPGDMTNPKDGHENGNWKDGGMMGGMGKGGRGGMMVIEGKVRGGGMVAGVDAQTVATFLGLTPEQVRANLDAGQSLAQMAVAQGKTRDDLKAFLVAQATAAIDAAIDATPTVKTGGTDTTTAGGNATPSTGTTTAPSVASTPTT